ncbi:MAG: protein CapI, partial [Candidatus Accumulibacter sp.]|nr:protein CapI [Accumulibacter sp.]
TYVDDIVEGVLRVLDRPAAANPGYDAARPDPATSNVPYRVFNIGNNQPVRLMEYIAALESALGRSSEKRLLPLQPGDVPATYADTTLLDEWVAFKPATPVTEGVARFVEWYRAYYG